MIIVLKFVLTVVRKFHSPYFGNKIHVAMIITHILSFLHNETWIELLLPILVLPVMLERIKIPLIGQGSVEILNSQRLKMRRENSGMT